ncbi:MAG: ferredoxin [Candidatus Dormibacteraeota bacterium]|nr:ferredoxin [Candidatus Dormibacteraeota bacterium]MBV9525926.1 ferredoxin [Candidatus Dormibacteraeota bacterium]
MRQRIRVDPIACKAHGVCAELFPERIRLDDWGYPIVDPRGVTPDLMKLARLAVAECPRTALHLADVDDPAARPKPEDPPDDLALVSPPPGGA